MQYNNNWLVNEYQAGAIIKYLFFWGHQAAKDGTVSKACFSQWWVAPFEVEGLTYKTAEHWMMAGKARLFNDEAALRRILAAGTAAEAKNEGRTVYGFDPEYGMHTNMLL